MFKPLSIALALSLAAAGASALADDATSTSAHMQKCVAKQKAKNDGRTDTQISQACATKMQQKYPSQPSSGNSMNDMQTPGTTPGAQTPSAPNYPSTTTPEQNSQMPK